MDGGGNERAGRAGAEALRAAVQGYEAQLGPALLELEVGPALRRMPGRETFLVDLADAGAPRAVALDGDAAGREVDAVVPAVVKRYAGSDAKEARAELLRGRFPRLPGRREAENLLALAGLGLAVPEVVYFCEAGASSLVVLEFVPHARTLKADTLPSDAERAELAAWVGHLHAAGWYHRDLYLEHVLVAEDGELVVIDAGRARCAKRPRQRWFEKDLGALLASSGLALDDDAALDDAAGPALRFLARYLVHRRRAYDAGWSSVRPPSAPGAVRRFVRGVLRRARHMRRHTPRFVHQPSP